MTVKLYTSRYRLKISCIFVLFLFLFVSCYKNDDYTSSASSTVVSKKSFSEAKRYTLEQLEEMKDWECNLKEIEEKENVEMKKVKNGKTDVFFRSDSNLLIIYYDLEENKVFSEIEFVSKKREDFDIIKKGTNVEVVKAVDKEAKYSSIYASNPKNRISKHYTIDGYFIGITYELKYSELSKKWEFFVEDMFVEELCN